MAVSGRIIGDNDFWIRILNSGRSISAAVLIAGLMARAAELSGDRFRAAARELNAFLVPAGNGGTAGVLGNLDEGYDAVLFYGLAVAERIDIADGMVILPFRHVQRFVDERTWWKSSRRRAVRGQCMPQPEFPRGFWRI